MTRVPAEASRKGSPPTPEQPCPEPASGEILPVAAAQAARVQTFRSCIPSNSWPPRRLLPQTPLDCAALRVSADALLRRAAKPGTAGRRSPSAPQSTLPPPRASPCPPHSATGGAARSGRCCVQGSEMRLCPFRRRTEVADSLVLFPDRARATPLGLWPPCAADLSASNQEWPPLAARTAPSPARWGLKTRRGIAPTSFPRH